MDVVEADLGIVKEPAVFNFENASSQVTKVMMMMMGVIVIVLLVYNQIQGFIHYIGSENVTKIEKNVVLMRLSNNYVLMVLMNLKIDP